MPEKQEPTRKIQRTAIKKNEQKTRKHSDKYQQKSRHRPAKDYIEKHHKQHNNKDKKRPAKDQTNTNKLKKLDKCQTKIRQRPAKGQNARNKKNKAETNQRKIRINNQKRTRTPKRTNKMPKHDLKRIQWILEIPDQNLFRILADYQHLSKNSSFVFSTLPEFELTHILYATVDCRCLIVPRSNRIGNRSSRPGCPFGTFPGSVPIVSIG